MYAEHRSSPRVENRSVPSNTVLPHILYKDLVEALLWWTETFGFAEHYRYGPSDGHVQGAQMYLGDAWIMLERAKSNDLSAQTNQRTQYLTVFLKDVDAHYDKVVSAGARIVEEINETVYGERQYGVEDIEGHYWLFSQHVRDVSP